MRPIFLEDILLPFSPFRHRMCQRRKNASLSPHKTEGKKPGKLSFLPLLLVGNACGGFIFWGAGRVGQGKLHYVPSPQGKPGCISWLWLKRGLQNFTLSLSFLVPKMQAGWIGSEFANEKQQKCIIAEIGWLFLKKVWLIYWHIISDFWMCFVSFLFSL